MSQLTKFINSKLKTFFNWFIVSDDLAFKQFQYNIESYKRDEIHLQNTTEPISLREPPYVDSDEIYNVIKMPNHKIINSVVHNRRYIFSDLYNSYCIELLRRAEIGYIDLNNFVVVFKPTL